MRAPRPLGREDLGKGVVRVAAQIAQQARKAVAEPAEKLGQHLAREERPRQARPGPSPVDMAATALVQGPLSQRDLRRAVVLAEILAPPVAERGPIQ